MIKNTALTLVVLVLSHSILISQFVEQNSGVTVQLNSSSAFDNQNAWICGDSGKVIRTTNSGFNWLNANTGIIPSNVVLNHVFAFTPSWVLAAGTAGNIAYLYLTTNSGANWQQVFSQSGGLINAIYIKNDSTGIMIGNPVGGRWSIWRTTNRGLNWDSTGRMLARAGSELGFSNCLAYGLNRIWFGTDNSRIYYSTNNGLNWSYQVTSPETEAASVWFDQNGSSIGYFSGNNVYRTSNFGDNWVSIGSLGTGLIGSLTGFPMWTGNVVYVRNGSSTVYFGFGNGQWYSYYTAPAGVYRHVTSARISGVPMLGYAVRNNGGVTRFIFAFEGLNNLGGEIPEVFELLQNYPNPFNPITQFGFRIADLGLVKLTVFDAIGREVAVLVNQQLQPGTYEASWDASAFPSGVYYYMLEAVDPSTSLRMTETKKMVLVK